MKHIIRQSFTGIGVVILLMLGGLGVWSYWQRNNLPTLTTQSLTMDPATTITTIAQVTTQDSPLPTPTPSPIPTLAVWVTPALPPIAWSPPPTCELHPHTVAEWQQQAHAAQETGTRHILLLIQRAQQLSPSLQALGDTEHLLTLLLEDPGSDENKGFVQAKMGLWLNMVGGLLNRETEIGSSDLPDVRKVKDLAQLTESLPSDKDVSKELRQAIDNLLQGKSITNPVCAHMLIMQLGTDLQSVLWTGKGFVKEQYALKDKIIADGWVPGLFQVSPNYQKLAIESYAYESGGPVYLYDLTTQSLTDLIRQLGELPFSQRENWVVIGWSPDSQRLLLGIQGQPVVFGVDLNNMAAEKINLEAAQTLVDTGRSYVDLLPDGTGFVYVRSTGDEQFMHFKDNLTIFDFATKTDRVVLEWSDENGRLFYPRISPTGENLVFSIETGTAAPNITYSLQMYNFQTQAVTQLAASDFLGRVDSIWSPDGRSIAFPWSAPETRGFYPFFPELDGWIGNLWIADLATRQVQQATHLQGAARRPVWSLDSTMLNFFTHTGQFGATTRADGKTIWPITEAIPGGSRYGSLAYLP